MEGFFSVFFLNFKVADQLVISFFLSVYLVGKVVQIILPPPLLPPPLSPPSLYIYIYIYYIYILSCNFDVPPPL